MTEDIALVIFRLGTEEFGAPVMQVREVLPLEGTTRVPRSAPDIEGVMNVRGQIVPIVDLRKRLGFEPRAANVPCSVLIVQPGGSTAVGMVVDSVSEVLRVPPEAITPAPAVVVNEQSKAYLQGVAKVKDRLILVCDLGAMVRPGGAPTP